MENYPSGTVTFLFTDIEGSTRYWEQFPEAMEFALQRHHEIVRTAIESNGGKVFRIVGDEFCTAFNDAHLALKAAVQAQRDIYHEPWQIAPPLRVRMALHTGSAEYRNEDYMGASLNHIGRLLPAGHGGQILLTGAAEALVQDRIPEGVTLRDLGRRRFRDLPHPEQIYQVNILDLPNEFPPLRTIDSYPNNLPTPVTSFIGRTKELGEVKSLLVQHRLLTLTGPGGTGKTRLALQAGSEVLDVFRDGVWLVELASLTDPDLIMKVIANVLHVRELANLSLQDILVETLQPKETLIVLDNCEHLIEQCALITDQLLNVCPRLHMLVSSREPLSISGEAVFRVPSLSIPAHPENATLEEIRGYESVRLFVERATAVNPHFSLTVQNATAIAQVCRRLDGIPLAIELAAARTKLLSAEQIAARLDDRFRLLTGGSRTALPRQQTLRALIDWSYDLLTELERDLLRQLSIFSGGWTLEAAETVCNVERGDVLDLLEQLVNKSLVIPEQQESEPRYHMLETIRQYAQEKLFDLGRVEPVRDRHLAFYAELANLASSGIEGPDNFLWMNRLASEHDNFRSALKWGLDQNPYQAARIAVNLPFFWSRRGFGSEGNEWLTAILQRISNMQGQVPEQENLRCQGQLFSALAVIKLTTGEYEQSAGFFQETIRIFNQVGDTKNIVLPYTLLGLLSTFAGKYSEARQLAEKALRLARASNSDLQIGMSLNILGQIEIYQEDGDPNLGQSYLEESITRLQRVGIGWFINTSRSALAEAAIKRGDLSTAKRHLIEGLEGAQAIGDLAFTNVSRSGLATVAYLEKRYSDSIRLFQDTIKGWNRLSNRGGIARCLECISFIFIDLAQDNTDLNLNEEMVALSAKLFGAAEAIRSASSAQMMPREQKEYDRKLETLRTTGPESIITKAWDDGKKMSFDEALYFVVHLPAVARIEKQIEPL